MRVSAVEERGAILIQVAISLLALTAMSAFVLDYGVMWTSRRQAQNAADAGALAGAIARAFDETVDPPTANGPAFQAASKAAAANHVWQTPPAVDVSWGCPSFVTGGRCVRVDVYQDGTNGSSYLPTYFAPLLGRSTQGTRATATAQAAVANATDCLKPLAIQDKWTENNPTAKVWTASDTFERYETQGKNKGNLFSPADAYAPPTASNPGTGFTVAVDYGTYMELHPGGGGSSVAPGDWELVRLPDGAGGWANGGSTIDDALANCTGHAVGIGDYLPVEKGAKSGPVGSGIQKLINLDLAATWSGGKITNSCAPGICADGKFHALSPRVAAIALYDPDKFQNSVADNNPQFSSYCPNGAGATNMCVQVTNIIGFFVESVDKNENVYGYLYNYPGMLKPGSSTVGTGSSFSTFIQLVR